MGLHLDRAFGLHVSVIDRFSSRKLWRQTTACSFTSARVAFVPMLFPSMK